MLRLALRFMQSIADNIEEKNKKKMVNCLKGQSDTSWLRGKTSGKAGKER